MPTEAAFTVKSSEERKLDNSTVHP
jgi:hypothetical protein